VQIEAVATVLVVTNGKPQNWRWPSTGSTGPKTANSKILMGTGSTIVESLVDGKRAYLVNGGSPNREEQEALDMVADIETTATTDDELFGTRDRKKIGDSWPANLNLLTQMLADKGSVAYGSVAGKTTLREWSGCAAHLVSRRAVTPPRRRRFARPRCRTRPSLCRPQHLRQKVQVGRPAVADFFAVTRAEQFVIGGGGRFNIGHHVQRLLLFAIG